LATILAIPDNLKTASKGVPKKLFISCVPVKNEDGNVIGGQLDYGKDGFEQFDKNCGKGLKL